MAGIKARLDVINRCIHLFEENLNLVHEDKPTTYNARKSKGFQIIQLRKDIRVLERMKERLEFQQLKAKR